MIKRSELVDMRDAVAAINVAVVKLGSFIEAIMAELDTSDRARASAAAGPPQIPGRVYNKTGIKRPNRTGNNIDGPLHGAVHDKIMEELVTIMREYGEPLTSRDLFELCATMQRRAKGDVYHGIAMITGHIRRFGSHHNIVEIAKRKGALVWWFHHD